MSDSLIEEVPAFRVTSYQNRGHGEHVQIRCRCELMTQVSIEEVSQHFASIIRTVLEGAKNFEKETGIPLHGELLSHLFSGQCQSVGKQISITEDADGKRTEHIVDHGEPPASHAPEAS